MRYFIEYAWLTAYVRLSRAVPVGVQSSATAFTINSDDPSAPQPWIRRTSGLLLFLSLSMFAVEAAA
jgi:hypothetical protein